MGGDQKNVLFRETQRFTLVYWVKLLILQPWGPCWSHGEKNYEHCILQMKGPVAPLWTHQKWFRRVSGGPQNGHFWPYLAILDHRRPSCPIWVEHRLNKVEHCFPHLRELVGSLWTHQIWFCVIYICNLCNLCNFMYLRAFVAN